MLPILHYHLSSLGWEGVLIKGDMNRPMHLLPNWVIDPITSLVGLIIPEKEPTPGLRVHLLPLMGIVMDKGQTSKGLKMIKGIILTEQGPVWGNASQRICRHSISYIYGSIHCLCPEFLGQARLLSHASGRVNNGPPRPLGNTILLRSIGPSERLLNPSLPAEGLEVFSSVLTTIIASQTAKLLEPLALH